MSTSRVVHITVVSDAICPWCYVGKRNLDTALKKLKSDGYEFQIRWRPFQLNPTTPKEGYDKMEYLRKKYGRIDHMVERLRLVGEGIGIRFRDGGRVVNTTDAHRCVELAEKYGKQHELMEALFRRYFEEGDDVSARDVLLAAAREAALPEDEVARMLDSGEYREKVADEDRHWKHEVGIGGVPFFLIGGEGGVELSGGQPVEAFLAAVRRVAAGA
eukprot:tig00000480_g1310.t1